MKKIYIYIAKNFLIKFIQVVLLFSLIIMVFKFSEFYSDVGAESGSLNAIIVSLLNIPDNINRLSPFLIFLSSMVTIYALSSKNELSIIRLSGVPLWSIVWVCVLVSALLGVFFSTAFNSLAISSSKSSLAIEEKYSDRASEKSKSDQKIFLRQPNNIGGSMIMQAASGKINGSKGAKIYLKDISNITTNAVSNQQYTDYGIEFENVSLFFMSDGNEFEKRIDAKKASFVKIGEENFWMLHDQLTNDKNSFNKVGPTHFIMTDLTSDFIAKTIIANDSDPQNFSLFDLPGIIKDLGLSGMKTQRFKSHFYSLISKPILFSGMVMISFFFGITHSRGTGSISLISGVILALILYITSGIVESLSSSSVISETSPVIISALFCAVGIILIWRKEHSKLIDF